MCLNNVLFMSYWSWNTFFHRNPRCHNPESQCGPSLFTIKSVICKLTIHIRSYPFISKSVSFIIIIWWQPFNSTRICPSREFLTMSWLPSLYFHQATIRLKQTVLTRFFPYSTHNLKCCLASDGLEDIAMCLLKIT